MASMYDLKIFKLNRIRYEELWNDALTWIKKTYNATNEEFTMASPFALLLSVILHLGRMIFYYIEDSITGLNIKTAYRPDQIKGLAILAGHDAGRAISARGAIRITYYDTGDMDLNGKVASIPNKSKISGITGANYIVLFSADNAKMTLLAGNYIDANIIQGVVKYQKSTADGLPLQSFNFTERNYAYIEEYFVNVYVNGEKWDKVKSIVDLGYDQKGVVVRTGLSGGIDIFFGNGLMGAIPARGAEILVEYIISDGLAGNMSKEYVNSTQYWQWDGNAYLQDGTPISLQDNFKVECLTDIIFGSNAEDIVLTLMIAPHVSRAFVLANETNYKYFFKRMNMFSDIEILKGQNKKDNFMIASLIYDNADIDYNLALEAWREVVSVYGETSKEAKSQFEEVQRSLNRRSRAAQQLNDSDYNDNTVYLLLIPDILKRISSSSNYFTCSESVFTLSEEEQKNILNLIDASRLRIISVENKILQPKLPRFSINAQVKIWEGYDLLTVYASCLNVLSNYLIKLDRKDMIPVSDLVALFENVDGIDSVKVWFDADKKNERIYNKKGFYGIDKYGDIILTRDYVDMHGNKKEIRDIIPIFRGGFVSPTGVEYSAILSNEYLSAFNLSLISYSLNRKLSLEKYTVLT